MKNLYQKIDVKFITATGKSRRINYRNGVLQGSSHGPLLAIIYYQIVLDLLYQTKIGGINIKKGKRF